MHADKRSLRPYDIQSHRRPGAREWGTRLRNPGMNASIYFSFILLLFLHSFFPRMFVFYLAFISSLSLQVRFLHNTKFRFR